MRHDMTSDDLIDMVYKVDPETRLSSVFVCDHHTASTIRKLTDGDGRFVWQDGLSFGEPHRVLGYPIQPDDRYGGLAFGPFSKMPDRQNEKFIGEG